MNWRKVLWGARGNIFGTNVYQQIGLRLMARSLHGKEAALAFLRLAVYRQ